MAEFKPITASEYAKKRRSPNTSFRAESAKYEPKTGRIRVQLTNGVAAAFPVTAIKGLETATPDDLRKIEVQGKGYGLRLPLIDADISVSRLFSDLLGSNVMAQAERRRIASQANGHKGGRPKSSDRATV